MSAAINDVYMSDSESSGITALQLELDSLKATTASLEAYLQQVRSLRESLITVGKNYAAMDRVNIEWLEVLEKCREMGISVS